MAELTKSERRALLQDLATTARRHGVSAEDLKAIAAEHDLPEPPPPKFQPGDRVAWSHALAGFHGDASVLQVDALPSESHAGDGDNPVSHACPIGTVVEAANDQGTTWVVAFDAEHLGHPRVVGASGTHEDTEKLVLTSDELVKVQED